MNDADLEGELSAFRDAARAWLEANFPPALRGRSDLETALMEGLVADGDLLVWKQRMAEKGWGTPTWPSEYGGGGLTPAQARVLQSEMARAGAFNPLTAGMGITMVGPTLLDFGTEAQKLRHLPPIARGEIRWCLGLSEPNAGSDLASLQGKAIDAGDHWRIDAQKIWTSGAQWSDWCGCLLRTDPQAEQHRGMSFLLIPMRQPGVEARPIDLISGASSFCETFFTEALADKDDLLGPLNGGWTVVKRLLQHERASQTSGAARGRVAPLQDIAKQHVGLDAEGRLADGDLRARLTRHLMDAEAHRLTLARVQAEAKGGGGPGNAASVLKNSATLIAQTRSELLLEIMGDRALGLPGDDEVTREERAVTVGWLFSKAMSIYGGSSEIQNNIVAKHILNLPDGRVGGSH